MYLKIKHKGCISFEYWKIETVITVRTITDHKFDDDNTVATVSFGDNKITINKDQDAWLVNGSGKVLEVINRQYIWS
ncbi:hypothetical protein ABN197_18400 [Providencia alcalifaciens]|uniref:hypothetical protein n=1 Tax=Providencia alcalifaciens TaxID=126385 RepID=UPI0032DBD48D